MPDMLYYFSYWNGGSSVDKKIISKIKALNKVGCPCTGVFITHLFPGEMPKIDQIIFIELKHQKHGFLNRFLHADDDYFSTVSAYIRKQLKTGDVIMHRFPAQIEKAFCKFVNKLNLPLIAEHNSNEWEYISRHIFHKPELGKRKSLSGKVNSIVMFYWNRCYYYYADRVWKKKILRKIATGITVSNDIDKYEKKYYSRYPTKVISNSIDVLSVPQRTAPVFDGNELKMIMISGWKSEWLGLDLLIRSMQEYKGKAKLTLYFAGEPYEPHKEMAEQLQHHKIIFEGYLSGEKMDALFNECHIAIGTLAEYRLGIKEASNLKTRDYMARGIPFVVGYHDTDLINNEEWKPFFYGIEQPENGFSFQKILDFAEAVLKNKEHSTIMRNLSFNTIHTPVKMKQLAGVIQGINSSVQTKQ